MEKFIVGELGHVARIVIGVGVLATVAIGRLGELSQGIVAVGYSALVGVGEIGLVGRPP